MFYQLLDEVFMHAGLGMLSSREVSATGEKFERLEGQPSSLGETCPELQSNWALLYILLTFSGVVSLLLQL